MPILDDKVLALGGQPPVSILKRELVTSRWRPEIGRPGWRQKY